MRLALVLGLARALAPPPASSARSGPAPDVPPRDVVHSQMAALQRSDVGRCYAFAAPSGPSRMKLRPALLLRCYAFAAPSNRLVTGPLERFERMVRGSPAYAPLVGCSRWEFVGALPISERRYLVRVRERAVRGRVAAHRRLHVRARAADRAALGGHVDDGGGDARF